MTVNEPEHNGNGGFLTPFLQIFSWFDRVLGWLERVVLAGCVLLMATLMSASVLGNQLFHRSIPGTEEVAEMLIVIITFIGVGYGARCARHISMSAVYDQLKGRARKVLLIIISVGTGALM